MSSFIHSHVLVFMTLLSVEDILRNDTDTTKERKALEPMIILSFVHTGCADPNRTSRVMSCQ